MPDRSAYVSNNAAWCDAVARAHGGETAFAASHWHNMRQSPPFYPNLITLTPDDAAEQLAAVRALAESGTLEDGWGVKDSFATLDLAPLGFEMLFAAQWLWRTPVQGEASLSSFTRVNNEPKLAAWERGFSGEHEPMHIFKSALLADPDIAFFGAGARDTVTAGFSVNRHAGVCAISNVFASGDAGPDFLSRVTAAASVFSKDLPLVSYMPDQALPEWQAAGFELIGPLRIWVKS
ncbi:MAG TPA: hypothetical protein VGG10_00470 [Rhizomicrobium sp.]